MLLFQNACAMCVSMLLTNSNDENVKIIYFYQAKKGKFRRKVLSKNVNTPLFHNNYNTSTVQIHVKIALILHTILIIEV